MVKNKHFAQTSDNSSDLAISEASGIYITDVNGKKYIDFISGISVNNLGHRHPEIIKAIRDQTEKYLHVMVYGEFVQAPQQELVSMLANCLPESLSCTYLVNSGSEAVEGAVKLAKRYTARTELIAMKNAYHGSSHGALSLMGNEKLKNAFRPLLPDCKFISFNNFADIDKISEKTACVIAEPVQGEAGAIPPVESYFIKLKERCEKTGALLILDEAQTGLGRTGSLFGFEQLNILPDILILAKAMGGGLPLAAFISSKQIMDSLKSEPELGHITTFGGNPICCAAAIASLKIMLKMRTWESVYRKETIIRELLVHERIMEIRGRGLLLAAELQDAEFTKKVVEKCMENGLITDRFLFAENCLRISPPLIISEEDIRASCAIILESIDSVAGYINS